MPHNDYWPASFEVISTSPKKFLYLHTKLFCGQKNKIPGGGLLLLLQNLRPKLRFFSAIFVTPISTLANNKRSLPTNSTTPGRSR